MSLRSILLGASIGVATLGLTGCGVIYSSQSFGSPTQGQSLSDGASRAEVLANLGSPNSIYRWADGEVFVYKSLTGNNWFGLIANAKRVDTIVVVGNDGIVRATTQVEVGRGFTLLALPWYDATHPFRTKELLYDPENYRVEITDPAAK